MKREQVIGKYLLLQSLGSGGFSHVYLGQHIYLKTEAAIKVLLTKPDYSREDLERFVQEARTIAQLHHSHIVCILDFDVEQGTPYLVMEYAPNGSLAARYQMKSGQPIAQPIVLSIIQQVASALQFAHDHRVIHCDVKPENMLLNAQDEVLLSDFGIAIVLHSNLHTQQASGTMHYMAPEQYAGKPGPASDQYALAVTAYQWLSGRYPFTGKTIEELYRQHMKVPPRSMREHNPHIPSAVDQVVLKALAKDPNQRFPSIAAFAAALEKAITSRRSSSPSTAAVSTAPSSQPHDNKPQALLPSLFSLLPSVPPTHEQAEASNPTQVHQSNPADGPDPRPDFPEEPTIKLRQQIHFPVKSASPAPHEAVTRPREPAGQSAAIPEPGSASSSTGLIYHRHTGWVTALAWSPDSARIASGSCDTTVHIWEAANGKTLLTYRQHTQPVKAICWSPSGGQIASGSWDATVRVWDAITGETLHPLLFRHDAQVEAVAWSPDGRFIASGGVDGRIHVWSAFNKRTIVVYSGHRGQVSTLNWSPDGEYIASAGYDRTIQVWGALTGQRLLTYDKHGGHVTSVAWSNGEVIASADEEGNLYLWSITNDTLAQQYRVDRGPIKALSWSPDGAYLASAAQCVNIWQVANPTVTVPGACYQHHTDWVNALAWSPNGRLIASASDDGTVRVWEAPIL